MNFNRVYLGGRLTRDPELRYTANGSAVASFSMAVSRYRKAADGSRQEETSFVDITAFGRQAEIVNEYCKKGKKLFVEGYLKLDQWTDKEGQKRSKLGVVVDLLQMIDTNHGEQPARESSEPKRQTWTQEPNYSQEPTEDIPF